jgi:hypothetical protein
VANAGRTLRRVESRVDGFGQEVIDVEESDLVPPDDGLKTRVNS